MSADESVNVSGPVPASVIEETAADWFGRRQFWNWAEEDQADLDAWLNENLANKVAYWRLVATWQRTERLNALRQPLQTQPSVPAPQRGLRFAKILVGGAVTVAVIVAAGGSLLLTKDTGQIYSTDIGEAQTLRLKDGSQIELNTDTRIRTAVDGNSRTIVLEKGEAFFQIRHDFLRPFTVMAAGHRITDLGTKFLVRDDIGRVEVALVEGKARVDAAIAGPALHSALLTPGDIAIASINSLKVTRPSPQAIVNTMAWRTGNLIFDDETLGTAAAEFNRYNHTKLVIGDPAVAKIRVAGKFPTDGVERFAEVVQHVFGLHVQSKRDAMVITR